MRVTLNYLMLAIIINVFYCGFSEKYIHGGLFVDGELVRGALWYECIKTPS